MDEPETLLAAPPKEEPQDAPQETRTERKRRLKRESMRRFRARHPDYCREYMRSLRARIPDLRMRYRKIPRGRICRFCGRTDSETCFDEVLDRCHACVTRGARNGFCEECEEPLYALRVPGANADGSRRYVFPCRACQESEGAAKEAFESLSEPQRRLTDRHDARRTLLLWDVLKATDGERILRADYPELMEQDHNGWKRLTEWAEALPDSLARSEKEREGKGLHVVLIVKRRALTAFLEPLVQYFTWKGWDSMSTQLATLNKNAKRA